MKRVFKAAATTAGISVGLFVGTALFLGKPRPDEPEFLKHLRYNMWAEALALLGYGLWHPHLLSSGAARSEKEMSLPGDALVPNANHSATYAITINAPAEKIWPWLVQMGDGRASWYAWSPVYVYPEFRDRVSPFHLDPRWQTLKVGDILLDGDVLDTCSEDRGAWRVREIQERRAIVYFSARDLVEGREFDPAGPRPKGIYAVTSWTFYISEVDAAHSRLLIRVRAEVGPPLLVPIAHLVFGNYDRVWERTILEGVKTRVEHWKDDKHS